MSNQSNASSPFRIPPIGPMSERTFNLDESILQFAASTPVREALSTSAQRSITQRSPPLSKLDGNCVLCLMNIERTENTIRCVKCKRIAHLKCLQSKLSMPTAKKKIVSHFSLRTFRNSTGPGRCWSRFNRRCCHIAFRYWRTKGSRQRAINVLPRALLWNLTIVHLLRRTNSTEECPREVAPIVEEKYLSNCYCDRPPNR